jgi:hypothetical protein
MDANEHLIGLKLTRSGQRAAKAPARARKGKADPEAGPREGSKKAHVLSLLSRPQGATIDDLLSATGWLPHTTRAALTGLRKEGYEFAKSKNPEGETVYRTEEALKAGAKAEPMARPTQQQVEAGIARLRGLSLEELRAEWRRQMRTPPPACFKSDLLFRALAYHLQVKAFGGLDRATARLLDRLADAKDPAAVLAPRRSCLSMPVYN